MVTGSNERFTYGRAAIVAIVLALAVAPVIPLLMAVAGGDPARPVWTRSFLGAVVNSLIIGAGVAWLSLLVGFPLGLVAALYRFPGRTLLVLLQALPLLLPSFLLAIGWSNLVAAGWFSLFVAPDGRAGAVFVLGMQAVPLPFFATWAACSNLTASQVDAARLHGGERTLLRLSGRSCFPAAALSALLAGVLSLSDSGAPLILGCRAASVEILTSFSALFDFGLAARQCLVLAGLALLLAVPVLLSGLPSIAAAVLARQARAAIPYSHHRLSYAAALGLSVVFVLGLGPPTVGLCLPAIKSPMLGRAAATVDRTWGDTLLYSGGAGLIAVALATGLAIAVGRQHRLRFIVLGTLLGLFALSPALAGLGVVQLATMAPAALDWLTRSDFTVAFVLGLRFLPIATLGMMRGVAALSPTWADAAQLHGVSSRRFLGRVVLPLLKPALAMSFILVIVLATADITTVLLVQPPGRATLPVAIFTVMANSPEGFVASLCLVYLGGVIVVMAVAAIVARWLARRSR